MNVRLSGDGQLALRALEGARTDQEATADHLLVARFDSIGMLDGFENPKTKLQDMSKIFALLKETQRSVLYNVSWFGYKIVYSLLVHNDLYVIPRNEIMINMANFTTHQQLCDKIMRYYTNHKVFWPGFDEAATVLAVRGSQGMSKITAPCSTCGFTGHAPKDCRMKGGAQELICSWCTDKQDKTIYGHGSAAHPCFKKLAKGQRQKRRTIIGVQVLTMVKRDAP